MTGNPGSSTQASAPGRPRAAMASVRPERKPLVITTWSGAQSMPRATAR